MARVLGQGRDREEVAGARIKTTLKCCFYRKRRSFVIEQGKRQQPKRDYKTSDRSDVSGETSQEEPSTSAKQKTIFHRWSFAKIKESFFIFLVQMCNAGSALP